MTGLRAVSVAHAAVLAALHAGAFPPGERWNAAAFATLLTDPGVFGLLSDAGGLALLRAVADEAELLTIGVAPAARRRGVGRALLAAGMREAARRGALALFLEVAASDAALVAFYAASGFAPVGTRRDYYGPGRDARVMRAALRPPCG